ncbi:sodium-coupled monocarboxylate transporter 2-like [Cloeon dipterum]|uniref:sodium-coupled monocarboxylate transporter 2-like n=1 Tax=Cloeon dipterum TaxID=197152 RepID=UPI00322077D8
MEQSANNATETDSISDLYFNADSIAFYALMILSAVIAVIASYKEVWPACGKKDEYKVQDKDADESNEYLMGGKKMSIFPVSLSLIASHISAITVLGVPTEIYKHGLQYWAVMISGVFVSLSVAYIFLPIFSSLGISSSYQYLELRFNKWVKRLASGLFVIAQLAYIPIVMYGPALAFSQVTKIPVSFIVGATCIVCVAYTTLGGLKAVVWADAAQILIMFISMGILMVLGAEKAGGWGNVWQINEEGGRTELFNLDPSPLTRHTFWTVTIGQYFGWLTQCGVSQGMVQRYLSVPDMKAAKWTLVWFTIGLTLSKIMSIAIGMLVYATYYGCDPLTAGAVRKPDQILPLYTKSVFGELPGFTGVLIAGVFSASISSMSTGLNAMSGVLLDLLPKNFLLACTDHKNRLRILTLFMGVVCSGLVACISVLESHVLQLALSLNGITAGAMLGLFTFGMFFPRATPRGAIVGAVVSLISVAIVVAGAQYNLKKGYLKHPALPISVDQCAANVTLPPQISHNNDDVFFMFRISYMYYAEFGFFIMLAVGYLVSLFSSEEISREQQRKELYSPLVHRWLPQDDASPEAVPLKEISEQNNENRSSPLVQNGKAVEKLNGNGCH